MRLFLRLLSLSLLSGSCFAQTITQTAPVWYAPRWVTVVGTVQLVSGSAMTPVGGTVPLPDLVDATTLLPVTTFDLNFNPISTTYLASGAQITINSTGGGLVFKPQVIIYPMTLNVPAGYSVKIHYEAPISGATVVATATPPPVTADGVKMPPASQILDKVGALWTVGALCGTDGKPGQVSLYRNGIRLFCSVDYATIKSGTIYLLDALSGPCPTITSTCTGWMVYNGTTFVLSPAPF